MSFWALFRCVLASYSLNRAFANELHFLIELLEVLRGVSSNPPALIIQPKRQLNNIIQVGQRPQDYQKRPMT